MNPGAIDPLADSAPDAIADLQSLAQAVRVAMGQHDPVGTHLGWAVQAVGPGSATVQMKVRPDMLNGLGVCHGGVLATLADATFALACNAGNEATVAAGFDIALLAPAQAGDVLTATATEVSRAGRTGLYDVMVVNQRGVRVAAFRGRSHALAGRKIVASLPTARELQARGEVPPPDSSRPQRPA
jgi:acyl-CoA thioesterase